MKSAAVLGLDAILIWKRFADGRRQVRQTDKSFSSFWNHFQGGGDEGQQ